MSESLERPASAQPARARVERRLGSVVVGALVWLACGAFYLTLPPSPDQFNHAYLGWRLLQGDVPYRDTIDMNWPGVMGLHAVATGTFGVNLWSWRALDFLLFAGACVFLCDLIRRAAGPFAAAACALTSPVLYAAAGYWLAGQHDMSAAQFLVVALWSHVRAYDTRRWQWQFLTGLLLGAAMLNKPTLGFALPLLGAQALLLGMPLRRVVAHIAAATVGLLAAIGAAVLAVAASGTTLRELIDATIVYNAATQYVIGPDVVQPRPRRLLPMFVGSHVRRWLDLSLGAVPALVWLARRSNRSLAGTSLWVLWLTGALSYFVQARGFGYHLAPAYLALVGLLPISIEVLRRAAAQPDGSTRAARAGLVALGCLLVVGQAHKWWQSYRAVPQALRQSDPSLHLKRFKANDGITVADAVALARRVSVAPPPDCALVVGTGSAINYLSRRAQPTRFYYFPVIARALPPVPMAEAWQRLWAEDLAQARCHYVFVFRPIHDLWLGSEEPASAALASLLRAYEARDAAGPPQGLLAFERR